MSAIIKTCTCQHEQQDKMYGKQQRVFNENTKREATCTVCGNKIRT